MEENGVKWTRAKDSAGSGKEGGSGTIRCDLLLLSREQTVIVERKKQSDGRAQNHSKLCDRDGGRRAGSEANKDRLTKARRILQVGVSRQDV